METIAFISSVTWPRFLSSFMCDIFDDAQAGERGASYGAAGPFGFLAGS